MSNTIHDFRDSISIGNNGEKTIKNWLERICTVDKVVDVSDNPVCQQKGVGDFVVYDDEGGKAFYELKTDSYSSTGNFFLEIIANVNKNKPGCIVSSKAHWLLYYFPDISTVYLISLPELQEWIEKYESNFKRVSVYNKNGYGSTYEAKGILVKRDYLMENLKEISVHTISNN